MMSIRNYAIFWGLAFLAFAGFILLFQSVLLPFLLGAAIAYLLNPVVLRFEKYKLPRKPVVILILLVFFLVLALVLGLLIPMLYRELSDLSDQIPSYIDGAGKQLAPFFEKALGWSGVNGQDDLKALVGQHAGSAVGVGKQALQGIMAGGQAFLGFLTVLVVAPVAAYFMMVEWPHITQWFEDALPRHSKDTIMNLLKEIDEKLSGFVRGQVTVMVVLGLAYAVALSLAGLKYGFLIGIAAGILSIIPMVGSTLGLVVSVSVAWFQSGEWTYVGIIAAIFLVGQVIEGNFITPKVMGSNVGLHPLWVFFALMAGGSLFGILGMLLAVPVAAVVSVLFAFVMHQYKKSPYYQASQQKPKKKVPKKAKASAADDSE